MALFAYSGRNRDGIAIKGELEANSADAVANQLQQSGITPISIDEHQSSASVTTQITQRFSRRQPKLDDLIQFSRQLYTLMHAGVPIIRSLNGLADNVDNPVFAEILRKVSTDLEAGHDLANALNQHPKVFSDLFVSMIQVGEQTGRLDEALLRIASYLEREKDTRDQIKSAMRYPIFVMTAISIAMVVINIWVIPVFAKIFEKFNAELPWQTKLLLSVSDFSVTFWPHILAALLITFVVSRQYIKTTQGKLKWDHFKLKIPVVGIILNLALLARFASAFAMMMRSGVPLVQGLVVVSRAVDNHYVEQHIQGMRTGIERGESLTNTAANSKMFTPLVMQMIAVGEETGAVDDMLEYVAEFYEREVDFRLKNLSSAIEPILIVIIGIMVLVLALGVFLPMWDLSKVVQGG